LESILVDSGLNVHVSALYV